MHYTAFTAFFITFLTELLGYEWSSVELQCVQRLNLDKATIARLQESDLKPEDNVELNRFLECSWRKQGKLEQNGEINWDKVDASRRKDYAKYMKIAKNAEEREVLARASGVVKRAIGECREKKYKGETHGQIIVKALNCIETSMLKQVEKIRRNLITLQKYY